MLATFRCPRVPLTLPRVKHALVLDPSRTEPVVLAVNALCPNFDWQQFEMFTDRYTQFFLYENMRAFTKSE